MKKLTVLIITVFTFYSFSSNAKEIKNFTSYLDKIIKQLSRQVYLSELYANFIQCTYLNDIGYIEDALKYCEKAVKKAKKEGIYPLELFTEYSNLLYTFNETKKLDKEIAVFLKINKDLSEKEYRSLINLLSLYISEKKLDRIIDLALKRYPKSKFLLLKKAETCINKGQNECAEKYYKLYIKYYPKDATGYYYLGKFYRNIEKYKLAEKYLLKALELNPKYDPALYSILSMYLENEEYKKIEKLLLSYLRREPNNIRYLEELFNVYMTTKQDKKAKEIIDRLVKLRPNEEKYFISRYYIYLKLNKGKEILRELKQKIKENPKNVDLLLILGLIYEQNKEYDKAIKVYKKILSLDKTYKDAYDRLAQIYYEKKDYEKAEKILKDFLKNYPYLSAVEKSKYYIYLADILRNEGKLEEGLKYLKKALKLQPDNPDINFYIAVYYDELGNWKKAKEYLEKTIKLNPNHTDALNYLGYSLLLRNESIDRALKLIKRAVYLNSKNYSYIDSLGWAYYKKGMYKKALEYLLKAYKGIGDDPVMLYHLGAVYEKLGDKYRAFNYYLQALIKLNKMKKEPEKGLREKIIMGLERLKRELDKSF
ncbi:MAG: hypothetical protein DSY66_04435 [Persephonella sp.]|nr:MAG: hypothetical protein DSY66_04435 [Persephonella sp.]RUM60441.1 MAG: hypothetical protein DSY53_00670 [Persephonella sp.]